MSQELLSLLRGEVLDDDVQLTLADLCRACGVPAVRIVEMVEEGIIEPRGPEPTRWRFEGRSVRRVRCALRLQSDLGVNLAGAALALDLLEELEAVRARLRRLEAGFPWE
ncbi:MAG: hypothetical protein Kow006_18860 [Gammaproteobacteria bacterium]